MIGQRASATPDVETSVAGWERAAMEAASNSGHEIALGFFRRALALVVQLPDSRERDRREIALRLGMGSSLVEVGGFGHPEIHEVMTRARELCDRVGDSRQLGQVLGCMANGCINRAELEQGTGLAVQSLEIGRVIGSDILLINGELLIGMAEYYRGNFRRSLEHRQKAMSMYRASLDPARRGAVPHGRVETGRVDIEVASCLMACSLWMLGYPDRAIQVARDAVALARTLGHPFSLAFALFCETVVHSLRRDNASQRESARQLIEAAEPHGNTLFRSIGETFVAAADRDAGAPRRMYESLSRAMETRTLGSAPQMIALVADVQLSLRRRRQALEKIELALDLAEQTGQHFWDAELWRLRGACVLSDASSLRGAAAMQQAEDCFRRAIEIARAQEARSWELRAATSLAVVLRRRGRDDPGLRSVLEWFSEGMETADLRDARALA